MWPDHNVSVRRRACSSCHRSKKCHLIDFPAHFTVCGRKTTKQWYFQCCLQVPFSRTSLDHKSAFVVDTPLKIFLFSGCNSSVQTRAKALDVIKHLRENRHCGRCEIGTIGSVIWYLLLSLTWLRSLLFLLVTDCRGWKACWWFWCWWVLEPVWRLCTYSPWCTRRTQWGADDYHIQETLLVTIPNLI
jgi:hypothetical protein